MFDLVLSKVLRDAIRDMKTQKSSKTVLHNIAGLLKYLQYNFLQKCINAQIYAHQVTDMKTFS